MDRLKTFLYLFILMSSQIIYAQEFLTPIADLLPTMYYVPQESEVNCVGRYGSSYYDGSEMSQILDEQGEVIAEVCTRFYRHLLMEGTAILNDRGAGKITVNYARKRRYREVDRCIYGEGIEKDLCLLPYHTIAADNTVHKVGEIIFIPKAKGLLLPDGTLHTGYFIVRDTGSAFNGIGTQRVDLFTGLDPDYNNVFSRAGFHHRNPIKAYKAKGELKDLSKNYLKLLFGKIF